VCHNGLDSRLAAIIRLHRDNAAEDLERPTIAIFKDLVMCGEASINECTKIRADLFTSIPFSNAETAGAFSAKQPKPSPKVLSSISFQKARSQAGGTVFVMVIVVIFFSW
jgi:hypothetical protein